MLHKATKASRSVRICLWGASGAGKTFSALTLASGLGSRIAVLDTERSSCLYADRFDFDVDELVKPYSAEQLLSSLSETMDYDVVIIDSFSHFWSGEGGILDAVNQAERAGRGGPRGGWSVGTPLQNKLLDAIRTHPAHKIVTLRAKTEYVVERDESGKSHMKKVGLAPVQRDGVEYEFDLVFSILQSHELVTQTSHIDEMTEFQGRATVELGRQIRDWFASGETAWDRVRRLLDSVTEAKQLTAIGKMVASLPTGDPRTVEIIEHGKATRERLKEAELRKNSIIT